MRILIDITHPAHAHFFRNTIRLLNDDGHEVAVTSREKDCTLELLDQFKLDHLCISTQKKTGVIGMAGELLRRNRALNSFARKFQPHVMTGIGGVSAAQVARWRRIPSVIFYDTENARLQNALAYPFASRVVVPECYRGKTPRRRTMRYRGYHELSYLHPSQFRKDLGIALKNGLHPNKDTFFIRLVSWQASHDVGLSGWSENTLDSVVSRLSQEGNVLISSEGALPEKFRPYSYKGEESAIHHILGHCRLYIGESATMASEAVVMGVPSIYAAPSFRGYITEQEERYGLAEFIKAPHADPLNDAISRILQLDSSELNRRHQKLLAECVNVAPMVCNQLLESAQKVALGRSA